MNNFDDAVKELVNYIKSHLMCETKTQVAIDFVMYLLRKYGTSALYLDQNRAIQFKESFKFEIEAALLGVYGHTH